MQSHDLTGRQIGLYKLTRKLGAGGMGAVYESYQTSVQRRVAIKVLPTHLAQESGYIERFEREVELAARLEHPHILPVYDYGTDDDISYIVMRMLRGGTLTQRLRKEKQLAFEDAIKILRQIGSALDFAHQEGIIHRDLKPSNIMFDKIENAYLADFGISKLVQESTSALTGTGQLIGTPSYMAPEQWEGLAADARTDLYALGVLAYTILTGQTPFEAPTPLGLMRKHMFDAPVPPTDIHPDLPMGIDGVIAKSLAKKPDERFQSSKDFVEAMIRSVHGEVADVGYVTSNSFSIKPSSERATSASSPTPTLNRGDVDATITDQMAANVMAGGRRTVATPSNQESPTDLGPKPTSGRGGYVIGGALLLIVVAALVGVFLVLSGDPDDGDDKTAQQNANATATQAAQVAAAANADATATEIVLQATQTIEAGENADATVVAEAASMVERGDTAFESGNFAEAIVRYSDAITHYPIDAVAYAKRSRAYFSAGQFENALTDVNQAIEIDDEYLDAYQIRADIYVSTGEFDEAVTDYSVVIEFDADNHLVILKRAGAYTQISEYDAALADIDRVIEIDPDYAVAYNARGDIYSALEDFEHAIEAYTQAVRVDPSFIEARFSRGSSYIRLEQFESARFDFRGILDIRPDYVESYRGLGDTYYLEGDLEPALENYQIYLAQAGSGTSNRGLIEDRVEEMQSALATANAPTPTQTNTPTATSTPTSTLTVTPSPTIGPTSTATISADNLERSQTRIQEGNDFYRSGDYNEAIVAFTDAILLNPTAALAYNNRGVSYQALEDFTSALNDYLRAIETNPAFSLAYANAGHIYYRQGDFALALEYYIAHVERAEAAGEDTSQLAVDRIQELEEIVDSQNDPTLAPTVTPRPSRTPGPRPTGVDIPPVSSQDETASAQFTDEGNLYNDEGDYQAAILSFNRAIELNPANVAAINNRGNAFYLNGQYQAALLDYNRALQIDPNSPIIYNNRGNANYELGDYFSALRDYDEAIYLDDRYAEAYYGRGSTYLLTEDYELALSDLGRALELGYSLPEQVYNERGLTYYAMMNNVAARADFQRSINANSEFAEAYFNLGNLEYDEENWDAALENYETYVTLTDSPEQDALDRMDELGERTGN